MTSAPARGVAGPATRRARLHRPDLRVEKELLRGGCLRLAAMDEVGRGALAGPVTVGVVVVTASIGRVPAGLRDSKLLTPAAREQLVAPVRRWAVDWAVGHASPAEIDAIGIIGALRTAARRALRALSGPVDAVLLDGNHDYLNPPAQAQLFDDAELCRTEVGPTVVIQNGVTAGGTVTINGTGTINGAVTAGGAVTQNHVATNGSGMTEDYVTANGAVTQNLVTADEYVTANGAVTQNLVTATRPATSADVAEWTILPVHLRIKADLRCAGVAGASVLAKTERDALMVQWSERYPGYGWAVNKGYATPEHMAAIAAHGPCDEHRRSWRLTGPSAGDPVGDDELAGGCG